MHTRDSVVAAIQAVAARRGTRALSRNSFHRESGLDTRWIYRFFGTWREACEAAGLEPNEWKQRIPTERIFEAMRAAFLEHGRIVSRDAFLRTVPFSAPVLYRRFGSWRGALAEFARWAEAQPAPFALADALAQHLAATADAQPKRTVSLPNPYWPSTGARPSGAPLGFRALTHAPTNEAGVVLAFGMVAEELGFAIDAVSPAFPDCLAKRRVGEARWEPVRIEFEYKSRNFHEHAHDPAGCDLIVCWEHDWPGAPLEVLELRAALARLGRDGRSDTTVIPGKGA